jgi:hypothetical protein
MGAKLLSFCAPVAPQGHSLLRVVTFTAGTSPTLYLLSGPQVAVGVLIGLWFVPHTSRRRSASIHPCAGLRGLNKAYQRQPDLSNSSRL